jgi:hypothetical protein
MCEQRSDCEISVHFFVYSTLENPLFPAKFQPVTNTVGDSTKTNTFTPQSMIAENIMLAGSYILLLLIWQL